MVTTRWHSMHCSRWIPSFTPFSTGRNSPWHMQQNRTSLWQCVHAMLQYARVNPKYFSGCPVRSRQRSRRVLYTSGSMEPSYDGSLIVSDAGVACVSECGAGRGGVGEIPITTLKID